ncbi:MAG: DUF6273 domain-containing protein [Ruminococcus sp.]
MPKVKLTEKPSVAEVDSAASVLITQEETVNGARTEATRRAPLSAIVQALQDAGIIDGLQTEAGLNAMKSELVKNVALVDAGIEVTFWDGEKQVITIPPSGVNFDALYWDQSTSELHIRLGNTDVIDPVVITQPREATDSTVKITNKMPSRNFTAIAGSKEFLIRYAWDSVDGDGSPTGNGTAHWFVNGTRVETQTNLAQGEQSYNILPKLEPGTTSTIRLTIEDTYGSTKTFTWTGTASVVGLSWNLTGIGLYSGQLSVTLRPAGTTEKTITLKLDGKTFYTTTTTAVDRDLIIAIPAQTYGAHQITASMSTVIDGETVEVPDLNHACAWIDYDPEEGTPAPIIAVESNELTISQFQETAINYLVYDPENEIATVTPAVDGEASAARKVERKTTSWSFRSMTQGTRILTLTCRGTVARITATVTSIGYDIGEEIGATLKLDPTGHSNSEEGAAEFGYTEQRWVTTGEETVLDETINHPFTYSPGFDWANGGFQQDDEGTTAFVVKCGSYVEFDRSLFDTDIKGTGKEIKIILKITNARNLDAQVIDGMSGRVGLTVGARGVTLGSVENSTTAPFCEDTKIEVDFDIQAASKENERFATVWLRGIPTKTFYFSDIDSWQQSTKKNFRIGSDEADVWIYGLKMYPTALSRSSINRNYIADCSDPEEMIARYERNNIFTTTTKNGTTIRTVSKTLLADAKPGLRIIEIKAAKMTTSKGDDGLVPAEIIQTLKAGGAKDNFVARNAKFKGQGTSSMDYKHAGLNMDMDFGAATEWLDNDGNPMTGYSMTENSIPVNYINIKLNIASSDNATNVVIADDYNTFNPCLSVARAEDSRVRDTIEGHPCAVFFTNTNDPADLDEDGNPKTVTVGAQIIAPGETRFIGCGDFNNSKKNYAVFGQTEDYPETFCVEISNNDNPQCRFKSDDLTQEKWNKDKSDETKAHNSFEFRYPKTGTDAMKQKWQELLSWVVSTDRTAATGNALVTPTEERTFDGVTYETDSAEYRAAKFKAEVTDWFAVDSLVFHYIFTSRHLMPDNRAKNTFCSYEPIAALGGEYRFTFSKNYDNDTAEGTDNSGYLSFRAGLEDTDTYNGALVFNASDSVLWCNVRDLLQTEQKEMYQTLEGQNAWSASRLIKKYSDYRSLRPEALVAEDMYIKYQLPWETYSDATFFERMNGTKEDQIRQFETYMEPYMATKYATTLATSSSIELRASSQVENPAIPPTGDMVITPFCDLYILVKYGAGGQPIPVRAKAGERTEIKCDSDVLVDTETYIYMPKYISRIEGLAALYTRVANFSAAEKLQRLELGSSVEGYVNRRLPSISFGANPLLEYIDLRGCVELSNSLNLSGAPALKELYANNTSIIGVTFAKGAQLRTAYLPAVETLTARDLNFVETFVMAATSLTRVWIDGSPALNPESILEQATKLERGRVTEIDWTLDTPDILTRLARLTGISASGDDADRFVLAGRVTIAASSAEEQQLINDTFTELDATFTTTVDSYTVTFKDADGTVLDTQSVREGSEAANPVTSGRIDTPTKEPTIDKTYTFIGWDKDFSNITGNLTVTAVYREATRRYTVRYWDGAKNIQTNIVEAYGSAPYEGEDLTAEEGAIWMGFDNSGTDVTSDLDIHAVYITPTLPDSIAPSYDFLYSDDPDDDSAYTLAQFYGIIANGRAKDFFQVGDQIRIVPNTTAFADSSIILQVYGFNHFKLSDGSGDFASVVFGMKGLMNAYSRMSSGSNVGGWPATEMNTFLQNTVYPNLPQQWKAMIKLVDVKSSAGGTSDKPVTAQCRLFLFSHAELGWDTKTSPYNIEVDSGAETVAFPIFTDTASRIKKTYNGTGSAYSWWLRSPEPSSGTNFRSVYYGGNAYNSNATSGYGVAFGFCI